MSLVGAVLVQGFLGVIGAFAMRRWRPSLVLDRKLLSPIIRFGVSYQLKNLVGFSFGAIAPVYGGRALGQTGLGFVNWAQSTYAFFPPQARRDHVARELSAVQPSARRQGHVRALLREVAAGLRAWHPVLHRAGARARTQFGTHRLYRQVAARATAVLPVRLGNFDRLLGAARLACARRDRSPASNVAFFHWLDGRDLAHRDLCNPSLGIDGLRDCYCIPMVLGNSLLLYVFWRMFLQRDFGQKSGLPLRAAWSWLWSASLHYRTGPMARCAFRPQCWCWQLPSVWL